MRRMHLLRKDLVANNQSESEATSSALKAQERRRRILPLSAYTTTVASRLQWHRKLVKAPASLRAKVLLRNRHDVVHSMIVSSVGKGASATQDIMYANTIDCFASSE
jgi:hypothetical protein